MCIKQLTVKEYFLIWQVIFRQGTKNFFNLILGFIVSCWVCMAGINAIHMEQKGFGVAIILSSVGSMLTATAMAAGLFWLMTTYLPL